MAHDERDIERAFSEIPSRDLTPDAHERITAAMREAMPVRHGAPWWATISMAACVGMVAGVVGWAARGVAAPAPPAPIDQTVRIRTPVEIVFPRKAPESTSDPRRWRVLETTSPNTTQTQSQET